MGNGGRVFKREGEALVKITFSEKNGKKNIPPPTVPLDNVMLGGQPSPSPGTVPLDDVMPGRTFGGRELGPNAFGHHHFRLRLTAVPQRTGRDTERGSLSGCAVDGCSL